MALEAIHIVFYFHNDFLMQFQSYVNSLGSCGSCLSFATFVPSIVCGSFLLSACSWCHLSEAEITNWTFGFHVWFLATSHSSINFPDQQVFPLCFGPLLQRRCLALALDLCSIFFHLEIRE